MATQGPVPPDFPGAVMFDEAEVESVVEVIRAKSPFRYYGPDLQGKVSNFEAAFAKMVGVPHCLAVSSGTAALIVGLRALGVGPGDEVIIPANTFIASAGAVLMCGAVPVFAEIDESLTLDPVDFEKKSPPVLKQSCLFTSAEFRALWTRSSLLPNAIGCG